MWDHLGPWRGASGRRGSARAHCRDQRGASTRVKRAGAGAGEVAGERLVWGGRLVCAHEMLIYGGDLSDTMKEPMPLKGEFVPTFPTRRDTPSPAG